MTIKTASIHFDYVVEQFKKDRRNSRLREATYEAIKQLILRGVLQPDMPLTEETLAGMLGVSRTPVREALAILEHERLIEAIPYKGLFVADLSISEFLQMYETLELIEPELARQAALKATDADIGMMEQVLDDAEHAIGIDVPEHFVQCARFQRILGRCSGNTYMTSLVLSIEERSDLYLITKWPMLPAENMKAAVLDRRAILAAVRAHDPEAAAERHLAHERPHHRGDADPALPREPEGQAEPHPERVHQGRRGPPAPPPARGQGRALRGRDG
ncbi:MAG: GntR family transcriptional regulator, partial [Blastochloris sp.]|nr:GntR family transcriptional regulator [Blastochloris sp.]